MKEIIIILLVFTQFLSFGQSNNDVLISFYDKETRLLGFKDSDENVVIEPKFGFLSVAKIFEKVIAVNEMENGKRKDEYYLLRNGKKFGRDSLYVFDLTYDCESEGYIRFKDPQSELIGMFDSNGKVTIPAAYNYISQMKNGYFVGLKNAEKEYFNHEGESDCNHFKWTNGTAYLVNKENEIIIKDFQLSATETIDWNTALVSDTKNNELNRVNFETINGRNISFVDNKKEFELYLDHLSNQLNIEKLMGNCFDRIIHVDSTGWTSSSKEKFLKTRGSKIVKSILSKDNLNFTYRSSISNFIPLPKELEYILDDRKDNCGGLKKGVYPIYALRISKQDASGKSISQNFQFMKFDGKIQLITAILRNE